MQEQQEFTEENSTETNANNADRGVQPLISGEISDIDNNATNSGRILDLPIQNSEQKQEKFSFVDDDTSKNQEQEPLIKAESSSSNLFPSGENDEEKILDLEKNPIRPQSTYLESVFDNPNDFSPEDLQLARENSSSLNQLVHYLMMQTNPNIKPINIAKGLFAVVIAGGSLLLYIDRTHHFAGNNPFKLAFFETNVNLVNFLFAFFAASETFDSFINPLPQQLRFIINKNVNRNKLLKIVKIGGLALVSLVGSIPFALATEGGLIYQIDVEVTNGVLNYFGYNNYIAEHVSSIYQFLKRSPRYRAYQTLLNGFLHSLSELNNHVIRSEGVPFELTNKSGKTFNKLMEEIARQVELADIQPPTKTSWLSFILKKLIPGALGAGTVLGGMTGYILATYQDLGDKWIKDDRINIPVTFALLFPFNYLAATFGAKTFIDIVRVLTCDFERPLAMRLYFARTIALMAVLTVFASFSYATSVDLVQTSPYFSNAESNVPHAGMLACCLTLFSILAGSGAVIFNNYGVQKLGVSSMETSARYWGKPDKKEKANWVNNMESVIHHVKHSMSAEEFVASAQAIYEYDEQKITASQKRKLFSLAPDEDFGELLEEAQGKTYYPEGREGSSQMRRVGLFSASAREKYHQLNRSKQLQIQKETAKLKPNEASSFIKKYNEVSPSPESANRADAVPEIKEIPKKKSFCGIM